MLQTTIRIHEHARACLRAIAEAEHRPMNAVLEDAIEVYRRQRFLDEVNAGYAELEANPVASREYRRELAGLEHTLLDGLTASEPAAEYGEPSPATAKRKGENRAGRAKGRGTSTRGAARRRGGRR